MQRNWNARLTQFNHEWFSKLTDGILAAVVLVLLWLVVYLAVRPIQAMFGNPGLLVYVLGLLAVSMFSLQQALLLRHSETTRAWYGMAGGFLAWSVTEVVNQLGVPLLPGLAGMVLLIMVALIVTLLWRHGLPVGARFFALTYLLNWVELFLMYIQERLAQYSPIFTLTYRATGYLALLAVALTLGWIVFQSRRRIHRVSAALAVWFFISLALYVFRGSLF